MCYIRNAINHYYCDKYSVMLNHLERALWFSGQWGQRELTDSVMTTMMAWSARPQPLLYIRNVFPQFSWAENRMLVGGQNEWYRILQIAQRQQPSVAQNASRTILKCLFSLQATRLEERGDWPGGYSCWTISDRSFCLKKRSSPPAVKSRSKRRERGILLLRPHRESTTIFHIIRSKMLLAQMVSKEVLREIKASREWGKISQHRTRSLQTKPS